MWKRGEPFDRRAGNPVVLQRQAAFLALGMLLACLAAAYASWSALQEIESAVDAPPPFPFAPLRAGAAFLLAGVGGSVLIAALSALLATRRTGAAGTQRHATPRILESESRMAEPVDDREGGAPQGTDELGSYAERLALAVQTSNTGLWDWNLLTHEVHYSPEWAAQLGVEPHALRPDIEEWQSRLHPDDRVAAIETMRRHVSAPGAACEMELRLRHADAGYRTFLCRMRSYADASGKPVRAVGSQLDITDRKRAENEMAALAGNLRQAWRKLSQVEEAERRWLARELHDTIGSALTALSLNLTIVRERLPEPARAQLAPRIEDSLRLLEETVETIRGMMSQLRPPVLDDYGVAAAVHWYLREVCSRAGIEWAFETTGEEARLTPEAEIALFRIAQGALTNVVKHSRARLVRVSVEVADRTLRLVIRDDGRGFSVERTGDDLGSPHWGLVTMRERAEGIGGRCIIESFPGKGTCVTVDVPR